MCAISYEAALHDIGCLVLHLDGTGGAEAISLSEEWEVQTGG